ncbi:MAG: ATP-binding cassette domain-containing protein, partial [Rhodospirillaceae bacterium]|nr:ATP-binding cassette domain-containing protein [Rhodospirillaceae bacterium]
MTGAEDVAPLLEIRDLRRAFGGIQAVNGVTLAVRRQEILGVIGPNGSGKSTLINLVSGQLRPDGGTIR